MGLVFRFLTVFSLHLSIRQELAYVGSRRVGLIGVEQQLSIHAGTSGGCGVQIQCQFGFEKAAPRTSKTVEVDKN